MTDDDTDDTTRTHDNGGPYRGLDPAQQDLYRRMQRLEERDEARERALEERDRALEAHATSRRTWRWVIGISAPLLLTALLALVGYAVGQISTSAEHVGETKAEIRALGKLIDLLETQVSELRRHAGLAPRGTVAVGGP